MNLLEKSRARRERIAGKQGRPKTAHQLSRRPDLPDAGVPRLRVGKLSVRTENRQSVDERGTSQRQPPRRTPR